MHEEINYINFKGISTIITFQQKFKYLKDLRLCKLTIIYTEIFSETKDVKS